MKRQGSGIRDQGSETLEKLLRHALPPIEEDADSSLDLWPAMQRRLRAQSEPPPARVRVPGLSVPWFDWALAGGLALLAAAFPAWIPVVLYYL